MILIWTRWGLVVLVFVAVSVALGMGLKSVFAPQLAGSSGGTALYIGIGMLVGAVALWFFSKYVLPKMDKPQPLYTTEKLVPPIVNEQGVTVTQRQIPVVNQQTGQQVYSQPSSSMFYIPVRFWPYVMAVIGAFCIYVGISSILKG